MANSYVKLTSCILRQNRMLINSELIAPWLLVSFNLVGVLVFAALVICSPWRQVLEVPLRQHLVFGSCLALVGFWMMSFAVNEAVVLHPLMITSVSLMVGFRLSAVISAFASIFYLLLADLPVVAWGMHWLVNGVIPAIFIVIINLWIRQWNPDNLFFYTLGIGFLGAGMTIPLTMSLTLIIAYLSSIDLNLLFRSIEPVWILLAMFPEAFINGMIVSSITVFYPHWMKTFDEDYFLSR